MNARSSSSSSLTCRPASQYFPELGVSRQPIRFISVDLPEPDGPMIATYSPLRICRSTPLSARTCSAPISYTFASSSVLMTIPELTRSSRYDSSDAVSRGILSPSKSISTSKRLGLSELIRNGHGVPCPYDQLDLSSSDSVFFGAELSTFTLDSGLSVRSAL